MNIDLKKYKKVRFLILGGGDGLAEVGRFPRNYGYTMTSHGGGGRNFFTP